MVDAKTPAGHPKVRKRIFVLEQTVSVPTGRIGLNVLPIA